MRPRILGRLLKGRSGPQFAVPEGMRVYAIGDVHGCLAQLNRLLALIREDLAGSTLEAQLIFLGDLIDRGPDSAGVIDRLIAGGLPTLTFDCIMGNHEEVMLDCLAGRADVFDAWLRYGGVQTLESYGLSAEEIFSPTFDLPLAIQRAVPPEHVQFLKSMKEHVRIGDYLFVHAGIRPNVSLDCQSSRDLRWIRHGFLDDTTDHKMMVVHGHTIVENVDFRPNRIAVDTGCYVSGRLSALVLEASERRVLTACA